MERQLEMQSGTIILGSGSHRSVAIILHAVGSRWWTVSRDKQKKIILTTERRAESGNKTRKRPVRKHYNNLGIRTYLVL